MALVRSNRLARFKYILMVLKFRLLVAKTIINPLLNLIIKLIKTFPLLESVALLSSKLQAIK